MPKMRIRNQTKRPSVPVTNYKQLSYAHNRSFPLESNNFSPSVTCETFIVEYSVKPVMHDAHTTFAELLFFGEREVSGHIKSLTSFCTLYTLFTQSRDTHCSDEV